MYFKKPINNDNKIEYFGLTYKVINTLFTQNKTCSTNIDTYRTANKIICV